MMTDEQKSKAMELKATIATTAATPSGAPREVRESVVALKRDLRRTGTTARELAGLLGLHETTLCRWEREARSAERQTTRGGRRAPSQRASSSFRMVQVVAPDAKPAARVLASVPASRGMRVAHAPSGLVIDGLDVEGLVVLLRSMS